MERRRLLELAGTAAVLAAGCLGRTGGDGAPTTDPGDSDDGTTTTGGTDDTTTGTDATTGTDGTTDEGTTADGDADPFADEPCPSFAEDVDRTVCAHAAGDADVSLTVSDPVFEPTTGDDTVETTTFTLHNEAGEPFGLNPYAWAIKRRRDGEWAHVAPEEHVEPWYTVADGETYDWNLSVETHPSPSAENRQSVVEDLDSGTYAFQITGLLGEGSDDPENVECVALFEVERE